MMRVDRVRVKLPRLVLVLLLLLQALHQLPGVSTREIQETPTPAQPASDDESTFSFFTSTLSPLLSSLFGSGEDEREGKDPPSTKYDGDDAVDEALSLPHPLPDEDSETADSAERAGKMESGKDGKSVDAVDGVPELVQDFQSSGENGTKTQAKSLSDSMTAAAQDAESQTADLLSKTNLVPDLEGSSVVLQNKTGETEQARKEKSGKKRRRDRKRKGTRHGKGKKKRKRGRKGGEKKKKYRKAKKTSRTYSDSNETRKQLSKSPKTSALHLLGMETRLSKASDVRRGNFTDFVSFEQIRPLSLEASSKYEHKMNKNSSSSAIGDVAMSDRQFRQPGFTDMRDLSRYMMSCQNCLVQEDSFQCPMSDMAMELKKWITGLQELLSFGCHMGKICPDGRKCCHSRDPALERAMSDMTEMARQMYDTFQSACANCPTDGEWSPWSPWEACSVTCGPGMRRRSRECNSPAPRGGGKRCEGVAVEDAPCTGPDCCSDGNWSPWSTWSGCSATCGRGMRERKRQCSNPPPNYCGRKCPGPDMDMTDCDTGIPCCVDGNWNTWSSWGQCSVTCGVGTVQRFRTCSNPSPNYCGRSCPGSANDAKPCDAMQDCCGEMTSEW